MANWITFLGEVKSELKRIVWPRGDEFLEMLVAVCVVVAFFAVILAAMDLGFSLLLKQLFAV